jgi:hypothetical protein
MFMSGKVVICEKAWLYKWRNLVLEKHEGKVCASSNGHLHFETIDNKRMGCPRATGYVTGDAVWLPNRNDQLALYLIRCRKEERLVKLLEKASEQQRQIKYLMEEQELAF